MAEKDIDAADWVEQDLLTKQEAGERLAEEIVRVRARLRELRSGAGDVAAVTMVVRRLAAMESIRDSLRHPEPSRGGIEAKSFIYTIGGGRSPVDDRTDG